MSSPNHNNDAATSTSDPITNGPSREDDKSAASERLKPPAKRPASSAVIEISDTESDDSDICAVSSYQASADEVKRIRGDDYSSTSSSSSDYSSDSESHCEDDSVVIEDRISIKAVRAQLYPRANRMEDPKLNNKLQSQELIDRLRTHWQDSTDLTCDEATLTADPFRVCLLHNFLSNADIINNIVDDMNTLDWSRKKMDLYEFHQTADLASLTWQRSIRGIYELLKTELMTWVSRVTGLQLTSVSASCSLYGPGDHLLVHDDRLAERRVAFILYLAPWRPPAPRAPPAPPAPTDAAHNGTDNHLSEKWWRSEGWSPHMGGALELLGRDERGPTEVLRRIFPRNNMLAFFKVGTDSYHQVSEVLSLELPRLSINGWFHGPRDPAAPASPAPPPPPPPPPPPQLGAPSPQEEGEGEEDPPPVSDLIKSHTEVVLLGEWVSAAYMSPRARACVQAQVERASEAALAGFLQPARLAALLRDLAEPDVEWVEMGPCNVRRYSCVSAAWAGAQARARPLRALLQLFSSLALSRLLTDCTDLVLAGYRHLELQRWRPGDFTLIPPREQYQSPRLEAVLYLGAPARALSGGGTTYLAPEEGGGGGGGDGGDGALLTVPPQHNTLSLVYCDAGAASFRKYLSRLAMRDHPPFYVLTCTYAE